MAKSWNRFVLSLLAALTLLLPLSASAEEQTGEKGAAAIDRLVILVHPCAYEIYHQPKPGAVLYPYFVQEQAAYARWLKAIAELPQSAFLVQIDMPKTAAGPDNLHKASVERLGAARVCRVAGEYQYPEKPTPLLDYYERIHKKVTEQIKQGGMTLDPKACQVELWGQSFEGCAPGYGSAVCRRLSIAKPFTFNYEMSAPDSPFLLNDVTAWELVSLPESDVVAYLFQLKDGTSACLFQARNHDQWLDHRAIELTVDPALFYVSDKMGKTTIWPTDPNLKGPQTVRMATGEERYLRTRKAAAEDLKAHVLVAKVLPEESEEKKDQ